MFIKQILPTARAKKCPARASPGRPGLALPGQGQPGPAIAGLGQPRPENWPGPAWPWPARAGEGWPTSIFSGYSLAWAGPGRPRPVTGWLGWSGRIKAIMTGKCQGQPEQFSWVDDLSHFCYKSGQVRYGQLTVFGITAV